MAWRLAAALAVLATGAQAQSFTMSDGMTAELDRIDIMSVAETGERFLALHAVPGFDPEPHGPVPPADAIRWHGEICEMIVPAIADAIAENEVERLRIRWQWTPAGQEGEAVTVFRFHENTFAVSDCVAEEPFGRGAPEPPSGAGVRWLGTETDTDPRLPGLGLRTLYRLPEPIASYDEGRLERIAMELCVSHATDEIARREGLYETLDYDWAAITFEERPAPNDSYRRGFNYGLDAAGRCDVGLSPLLVGAIRSQMGLE